MPKLKINFKKSRTAGNNSVNKKAKSYINWIKVNKITNYANSKN